MIRAPSKATRPATDLVNEPRASNSLARWSTAVPETAIAAAFIEALKRRAGRP
jgi:hypothetical protein